jgi:geranylgeranyl transferase type-2 subunit alpha
MHGRRRAETKALKRDPKIAEKLAKKATLWYQLQTELLKRRANSSTSDHDETAATTLQLIDKALSVNPDPLWLWNFRRDLLCKTTASSDDACLFSWESEASMTQAALENNPKAYGAWHHRKWACQKQTATTNSSTTHILESELALTAILLQRDERNFHCWSYRRFVVSCLLHGCDGAGVWQWNDEVDHMGAQIGGQHPPAAAAVGGLPISPNALNILEQEWNFTDRKIRDNFSNFSAFHYRSKLLPILKKDLTNEFETIVNNAICTEPDDQTAWWYQSFLLEYAAVNNDDAAAMKLDESVLTDHIALLRELQEEMENKSKWVLLGLFKALSFFHHHHPNDQNDQTIRKEQRDILQRLEIVDSDRKMRYKHLLRNLDMTD